MPDGDGGTAAVFISSKFGNINNITVNNNLLTGNASYTLYSEAASGQRSAALLSPTTISNVACMATSPLWATTRSTPAMSCGMRA